DQSALLCARLEDLENELLFAHAGRTRHVERFGNLRQPADAHVLQRRELEFFWWRRGRVAVAAVRARLRSHGCRSVRAGVRLHRAVSSLSISFHKSSSPSPVTADTGSTGCSCTDSSSL